MTNHIPDESPKDIVHEMLDFILEIKRNMPRTNIYISLILPKHDNSWLPGINYINKQICEASFEIGFRVIQHSYFATRGYINSDLISRDGVHLSRLGIKQLGMDIKRALKSY